jgi:hypothetical protein
MEGRLPGALISGHNLYHTADGNYIKLSGIRHIPPTPPTAPKVGTGPPGMYMDKTLGKSNIHSKALRSTQAFLLSILNRNGLIGEQDRLVFNGD